MGINTRPAVGQLFNGGSLDIITGLSTGGVYHIQTEVCVSLGDYNGDGSWDVLDIVSLVSCVLAENCTDLENSCAGDLNGDGLWNILDIVFLANCVLAENCIG